MKRSVVEHAVFGVLGGLVYMGIEVLWRGRSHPTMLLLGGVCFVVIGRLNERQGCAPPLWAQAVAGGDAAGAGDGTDRKPVAGMECVGLQRYAPQFYGADLPALQPGLAAAERRGRKAGGRAARPGGPHMDSGMAVSGRVPTGAEQANR